MRRVLYVSNRKSKVEKIYDSKELLVNDVTCNEIALRLRNDQKNRAFDSVDSIVSFDNTSYKFADYEKHHNWTIAAEAKKEDSKFFDDFIRKNGQAMLEIFQADGFTRPV